MNKIKYELSKEDEKRLASDAIFVFDTSSLLNIYNLSNETRVDFFKSINQGYKGRLWLPYYVYFEYNKNKNKLIDSTISKYAQLKNNLNSLNEQFTQIENKTKLKDKHPIINNKIFEKFKPKLEAFKNELDEELRTIINSIEATKVNDEIFEKIKDNFEIGESFSYSEIIDIIKEGEFRFKHSIPPGYLDEKSKLGFQKFADLIIWKEIIKHSTSKNKPIILITDDNKEDWWVLDTKRNSIKPREELIDEMREKSNVQFWMYNTSEFIENSSTFSITDFLQTTLEEIKFISLINPNDIVYENIKLSSDSGSGDNELHRIERLTRVIDFISKKGKTQNIMELNDHEGMLTVSWSKNPTVSEKEIVEEAWESESEPKENVVHNLIIKNWR
jgi:hypothetical protein